MGADDADINIDLGKELGGDLDEGTNISKFQEEEGAIDLSDPNHTQDQSATATSNAANNSGQ